MKKSKKLLSIEQLDAKLRKLQPLRKVTVPSKGWVNTIRTCLGMSLRQLGEKLQITPQSAMEIETREQNGSITLRNLHEIADALDMVLVYGFVPKDKSIEAMIEKKARALAKEIVLRTSISMKLEGQENSKKRIEKAIKERTEEFKNELPKILWD